MWGTPHLISNGLLKREDKTMAKVLGETARYVTGQTIKRYKKQVIVIFLA